VPKDLLKDLADRLGDEPFDHSKDGLVGESTEENSYRVRGGKINEASDRTQNEAVKLLEKQKALKAGKKKAPKVERKWEPTELPEPMSAEELAARTKQALKTSAEQEAPITVLKRSRAGYKANLNKALSEGRQVSPPIKSAIMPTVLTRESRAIEERFLKDSEIHAQFQAGLKQQLKEHELYVKGKLPKIETPFVTQEVKELAATGKFKAPAHIIKGLQIPAPSRDEIPEPKKVRLSGDLGPMRPVQKPSVPKIQPIDAELGNLETKNVYPTLNRDLSRVFNEPYKGDRPRGEIPKAQYKTWFLRLKSGVGGSKAEETSSAEMDKIIEGAKTATDSELKDLANRIKGGDISQRSADRELAAKASKSTAGEKSLEFSFDAPGADDGVKRYKETVPTPVKPTSISKDMLSGKAADLPGAAKLLGVEEGAEATSKIVKAAEAGGEVASIASKSARLSELLSRLSKGAGKAGIAALILGGGIAGLKKIGAKLEE